jgi:hypothetical protein
VAKIIKMNTKFHFKNAALFFSSPSAATCRFVLIFDGPARRLSPLTGLGKRSALSQARITI